MLLFASLALANPEGPAVPPPHRLAGWDAPVRAPSPGTRVTMIVEARSEVPVTVEVADGGAWRQAIQTWHRGRVSVLVADLTEPRSFVHFRSSDAGRIVALDWDLFTPSTGEPRLASGAAPPPTAGVLPAELVAIGVTPRADWGADPTQCTSTEDDWYRMAIHHTAGSQTYGGTVQGAVQALQAYARGTGEYCDIPYQFLVGYDGSLWEGRPYDYYSGATGGGNNDGNIAVCFLGCYHPSDCAVSNAVTDAMMSSGQLLVQTLVGMHGIPSDTDSIRGHRDWPDNATACPGDWLYDRLDELRTPLGRAYAGTATALECDGGGATLSLQPDETGACTLSLANGGTASWSPTTTKLAPIPRDSASPLAAPTWLDAARITGVSATTAPGALGSFAFEIHAPAPGEYVLSLGVLEEGVTWFADDGGPADGALAVTVTVNDSGTETGTPTPDSAEAASAAGVPGAAVPMDSFGCGCDSRPGRDGGVAAFGAAIAVFWRRGAKRTAP